MLSLYFSNALLHLLFSSACCSVWLPPCVCERATECLCILHTLTKHFCFLVGCVLAVRTCRKNRQSSNVIWGKRFVSLLYQTHKHTNTHGSKSEERERTYSCEQKQKHTRTLNIGNILVIFLVFARWSHCFMHVSWNKLCIHISLPRITFISYLYYLGIFFSHSISNTLIQTWRRWRVWVCVFARENERERVSENDESAMEPINGREENGPFVFRWKFKTIFHPILRKWMFLMALMVRSLKIKLDIIDCINLNITELNRKNSDII